MLDADTGIDEIFWRVPKLAERLVCDVQRRAVDARLVHNVRPFAALNTKDTEKSHESTEET